MTLTERDKKLLAILAILGALAGYWFLALKPKRAEVAKLTERVASKKKELDSAKQRVATYLAAQVTYSSDYSTVVRLGEAIPEDDAMPSLLIQLDTLAGKKIDFTKVGVEKYPQSLLTPSLSGTPASALGGPPATGSQSPPGGAPPATAGASGTNTTTAPTGKTEAPAATDSQTGKPGAPAATGSSTSSTSAAAGTQPAGLPFEPLEVGLKFEGNFFRLYKLFANIDRLVRVSNGQIRVRGRLVFVEGFKLEKGRAGFPQVSVSVGALVFSLPENESLSGGATREAPPQGGPQPVSGKDGSQSGGSTPTAVSTPSAP